VPEGLPDEGGRRKGDWKEGGGSDGLRKTMSWRIDMFRIGLDGEREREGRDSQERAVHRNTPWAGGDGRWGERGKGRRGGEGGEGTEAVASFFHLLPR